MRWLARQERIARTADALLLCAVLVASAGLLSLLTTFRYGRDQGIYAAVADAMARGGAPYKDAWDFKPPLIFFVYAAARSLLGQGMLAVRLLEAAALASLLPAFVILSRRFLRDGRPGVVAAGLAIFCQLQLEYWDTAQPESFGGVLVVWALVCATYRAAAPGGGAERRERIAWFGAGALYALAALGKPPLGGGFLVSLGFVAAEQRRLPERGVGEVVLAFCAGAAAMLAACAAYFVAFQAWREALEALFVFAPQYHAVRFEAAGLPAGLLRSLRDPLLAFSAYLPVGTGLLLLLPPISTRERRASAHVTGVLLLQLLGVALQARFYPYHFGAALSLVSLLAGWGIWKGWLRARARPLTAFVALVALGMLAAKAPAVISYGPYSFWQRMRWRAEILAGRAEPTLTNRLHSTGDVHHGVNRSVAHWIQARTPAGSSLYVWGFEPMLYTMARRRPASAYVYNVPQRLAWSQRDEARRKLLDDLRRDPPAAIVVVEDDVREGVTGNRLDSQQELQRFPELSALLEDEYLLAWRLEDLTIYERRR